MASEPKEGELFRRNYLRSPTKLADSVRARRRISTFADEVTSGQGQVDFVTQVRLQLGIDYPTGGYGYLHSEFWERCEVGDFLSAVTIFIRLHAGRSVFLAEVRRIFAEEDLQYRIDDKGGVHYLVDASFAANIEETIAGLRAAKFTAARIALEQGLASLGPTRQSGKGLIRGVFEAVESAFLVIIGPANGDRLNAKAIEDHLAPLLLKRYSAVPEAPDKVQRFIKGLKGWAHEVHPYRHGTASDQEHEAPIELAILSANTGMGYLRLLAAIGEEE